MSAAAGAFPAVALVAGVIFVASQLNHGWVPHDDGTLAQSAERVLDGELPHRDFAELYTGGLTFLNAGVFWAAGDNLFWLRVPMFLVFLVYLLCVFSLARRLTTPAVASLAALFAVAWGPPVYPAAMPSWYTLYFAVIGAFALLRHRETAHARWLVLAGLMGGLSLAFKITGVWYIFAVALYCLFADWAPSGGGRQAGADSRPSRLAYRSIAIAAPVVVVAVVAKVLSSDAGLTEVVNFFLPVAAVSGAAIWSGLRVIGPESRERLLDLLRLLIPFLGGVLVPLAVLMAPYLATGSIGDLYEGTLVTPQERLQTTYLATAGPAALVFALPVLAVFVICRRRAVAARRLDRAACVVALALVASSVTFVGYQMLWFSVTALLPAGVLLGVFVLLRYRERTERADQAVTYLLLALAALMSLVQFPFGAPVYFCFVAPLAMLAWLAMFRLAGFSARLHGFFPLIFLCALVVFGFVVNHGTLYEAGLQPVSNSHTAVLDRGTAWIRVTPEQRSVYRRAAFLLRRHSSSPYIFAGPDTPELYVLSGRRNPTRSLFDLLDPSNSARGRHLLRTLDERRITAIAINHVPSFSNPLGGDVVDRLRVEYPHRERVSTFEIRWK
jgi:hypothetical protein